MSGQRGWHAYCSLNYTKYTDLFIFNQNSNKIYGLYDNTYV